MNARRLARALCAMVATALGGGCEAPNPAYRGSDAGGGAGRPGAAVDAGSAGGSMDAAAAGGTSGTGGASGAAGTSGAGGAAGRADAGTSTLASGLVASWDMEEGSGSVIHDAVASPATDGTLKNGARFVSGGHPRSSVANAWALAFDGKGAFVELAWREALQLDGPKSFSLWYRNDGTAGCTCVQNFVALIDPLTTDVGLQIGIDHSRVAVWKWGGQLLAYAPEPAPGSWHHVAHTYDGNTHVLYVDGKAVASGSYVVPPANVVSARLGTHYENAEFLDGLLDDVRVWNRALTASEVAALANGS